MSSNIIYINTDGGARGNPGPAGIGVVFFDETEKEIHSYKEFIGVTTNNRAEYVAIYRAILILKKSEWYKKKNGEGIARVICRLDSKLVVEQLLGNYKVKEAGMIEMKEKIQKVLSDFEIPIDFVHIGREQNKRADKLVNEVLDEAAPETKR